MLLRKLLITTGISVILFGITYGVIETSGLSLRDLSDRYRL
jgi:predicted secreted protein